MTAEDIDVDAVAQFLWHAEKRRACVVRGRTMEMISVVSWTMKAAGVGNYIFLCSRLLPSRLRDILGRPIIAGSRALCYLCGRPWLFGCGVYIADGRTGGGPNLQKAEDRKVVERSGPQSQLYSSVPFAAQCESSSRTLLHGASHFAASPSMNAISARDAISAKTKRCALSGRQCPEPLRR